MCSVLGDILSGDPARTTNPATSSKSKRREVEKRSPDDFIIFYTLYCSQLRKVRGSAPEFSWVDTILQPLWTGGEVKNASELSTCACSIKRRGANQ